jgi:hypothetical protein
MEKTFSVMALALNSANFLRLHLGYPATASVIAWKAVFPYSGRDDSAQYPSVPGSRVNSSEKSTKSRYDFDLETR